MGRIIASIFLLAATVMVFFTWTNPVLKTVKTLKTEQNSLDLSLNNLKEVRSVSDQILSEYNSIPQEDLNKLNKLLPSKMKAIEFVMEVENMVKKHNLLLKNVDIQKPDKKERIVFGETKKPFEKIPLSISVVGSYASFVSFLSDMERSLSVIDVESLNFRSGKIDSYQFSIKASTYWKGN